MNLCSKYSFWLTVIKETSDANGEVGNYKNIYWQGRMKHFLIQRCSWLFSNSPFFSEKSFITHSNILNYWNSQTPGFRNQSSEMKMKPSVMYLCMCVFVRVCVCGYVCLCVCVCEIARVVLRKHWSVYSNW